MSPVIQFTSVEYPGTDGKPMGETDLHRKTKKSDTVTKPRLYCRQGVKEYFAFDPTQDYSDPPLHGFRLMGDKYERIEADSQGRLVSEELGPLVQVERRQLAMFRSATGQRLLTEREARLAAESEVARLRDELRRRG